MKIHNAEIYNQKRTFSNVVDVKHSVHLGMGKWQNMCEEYG